MDKEFGREEKCVIACEGLSDDALDGGWTAKGIIEYAKKMESAIEHGKFLCTAADNYIKTVDDYWDLGDSITESMLDDLKDSHKKLAMTIYEFSKRAK